MMQQQVDEGQPNPTKYKQELKLRPLTQSEAKLEQEQRKDQFQDKPIFRIDTTIYNLSYQLDDPAYHLNSRLLTGTKIRPQDREKLKSWMLSETYKIYERETYCQASRFLDMFFMRGFRIQRNVFQCLGIACLILAAKNNERRVPSISYQVFDRTQIYNFEKQLLSSFNYRLNPVTYISLCNILFFYWDNYDTQKNPYKPIKYLKEGLQSIIRVRTVMETLDCIDLGMKLGLFLVHQSLEIPVEILVLNVFVLENRRFCLLADKKGKRKMQTAGEAEFAENYSKFMDEFVRNLRKEVPAFSSAKINQKVILYCLNFSRINPKIEANKKYKHFIYEISRQTYNPEISQLAQNYIMRRSNMR